MSACMAKVDLNQLIRGGKDMIEYDMMVSLLALTLFFSGRMMLGSNY